MIYITTLEKKMLNYGLIANDLQKMLITFLPDDNRDIKKIIKDVKQNLFQTSEDILVLIMRRNRINYILNDEEKKISFNITKHILNGNNKELTQLEIIVKKAEKEIDLII